MADPTTQATEPLNPTSQADQPSSPDLLVSVILPTYNERDNIVDLIEAVAGKLELLAARYEVLVVDDSSPDGTAQLVRERYQLASSDPNDPNEWHGPLYQAGIVRVVVRVKD